MCAYSTLWNLLRGATTSDFLRLFPSSWPQGRNKPPHGRGKQHLKNGAEAKPSLINLKRKHHLCLKLNNHLDLSKQFDLENGFKLAVIGFARETH